MTPKPSPPRAIGQSPVRRVTNRRAPARRKRLDWRIRLGLWVGLAGLLVVLWAVVARQFAPQSNTGLTRFDAIIVLGYPADADGNPTPRQLARVNEAVREYERGIAPRLIVTGAGVRNHVIEAQVMARTARAEGVPGSVIYMDTQARDTIQNACYAARIMKEHGWRSAEVISADWHLPRAGMIFSRVPIEWRAHPAPALVPEPPLKTAATIAFETLKTVRYLVWARQMENCEP